ncbi:DUF1173 family protein [Streptomyces parvus]|uniref:DUF1173 family protein n=1 Tax=Streptomyces parvus TaxID=66428 RepID=UPI0035561AF1
MAPLTGPGRIRLAGRTVQLTWLREHSAEAAPLFARARAEVGYAWCLCRRPALRLVIRCTRAGRYHVAGWPGEGERHDPSCPFHKLGPGLSGRDRYSTQAIQEADDGVFIRLATPPHQPPVPARIPRCRAGGHRHRNRLAALRRPAGTAALAVGTGPAQRLTPADRACHLAHMPRPAAPTTA